MSHKDSSTYILEEKDTSHPRRNSISGILAFFFGVGVVCSILFVPSINAHFRKMFSSSIHPALNPGAIVWTKKDTGIYYCPGSTFYGSGNGLYMKQGDALTAGYQPVLGTYCTQKGLGVRPGTNHKM